jgi:hypothetical protein
MVEAEALQELPADLAGARLLEVVQPGAHGTISAALVDRGTEEIVESDRPQVLLDGDQGRFDYILCADILRSSPYPMALLADLWRLAAPGAVLLLEAEIVPGLDHSAYARFVPAAGDAGWVPGRLALRWMVEVSGFDVERWLGESTAANSPRACLRAVRAERTPASSTPPPVAAR